VSAAALSSRFRQPQARKMMGNLSERLKWLYLVMTVLLELLVVAESRSRDAFVLHCSNSRRAAISRPRWNARFQQARSENEETSITKETHISPKRRVCVVIDYSDDAAEDSSLAPVATELARNLDVPVCPNLSSDSYPYTHALVVVPYCVGDIVNYAVAIQNVDRNNDSKRSRRRQPKQTGKSKPFFVEFCPPSNSRLGKRSEGQSGTDLLIQAASLGKGGKAVYDLTAGFGQDSLLMAQSGAASVCMVERDPIVAALLSDALRRLKLIASDGDSMDPQTQRALNLSEKLTLEKVGDAVQVAKCILDDPSAQRPDVCYVDPMFPTRRKSAAVKKNMQILHGLLGSQATNDLQNENTRQEEQDLLEAALNLARERVVVKRPINADRLGTGKEIKPSYEVKGSVNRWDVYVK